MDVSVLLLAFRYLIELFAFVRKYKQVSTEFKNTCEYETSQIIKHNTILWENNPSTGQFNV
jgi:hypothetical protein